MEPPSTKQDLAPPKGKPRSWLMWPLTICLQGPPNMQHRHELSVLGRGDAQIGIDVFWGGRGQVLRGDPADIQASAC